MKVLVADDDAVCSQLLRSVLENWGYEVVAAGDGTAAWQALQASDAPGLAVLDWMMPGLDGPEICRQLRRQQRDRYTYVLLLTARKDHADMVRGLESGADDCLTKPFDPDELRARLNTGRRILQLQNELIAAREAMRLQATRDALTGVYNHAAILEILDRELARGARESRPVGVVLADLDHFKRVNDNHGHLTGDAVLRAVSERAVAAMRPYDLIGRYGGEEFLLVLPGCDVSATLKVCERIRARIAEQSVRHEEQSVSVSLSLGATVFGPPFKADAVALVHAADDAMYRAKAAGRNRVEFAAGPGNGRPLPPGS
jgi:diguanylate cyclase (GGDEF)-like protein